MEFIIEGMITGSASVAFREMKKILDGETNGARSYRGLEASSGISILKDRKKMERREDN